MDQAARESMLSSAARAYALNGYIKITGIFSQAEIENITGIYDAFHRNSGASSSMKSGEKVRPMGSLLEDNSELTEAIFSKDELLTALQAVAGHDVQFAGSDAVHVYNDSIGIHRDTFYKYDFPKALVFLSDSPVKARFSNPLEQRHGGAFMVLPGSHSLGDSYTARSSQLCNWPYDSFESYSFTTPIFRLREAQSRGGGQQPAKQLLQCHENRDKYHAFAKITFRRGDVVIFSTRALHALYPLFQENTYPRRNPQDIAFDYNKYRRCKPLKLLGILFIEGFSKHFATSLPESIEIQPESNCDLLDYISTVYNLRLYNTTADHARDACETIEAVSGLPMGLNRSLGSIHSTRTRANIKKHNLIHHYYEANHEAIDKLAGGNKKEIDCRFLSAIEDHKSLINTEEAKLSRNLSGLRAGSADDYESSWMLRPDNAWLGIANYLPFIENESVYLFYKKMQHFLGCCMEKIQRRRNKRK